MVVVHFVGGVGHVGKVRGCRVVVGVCWLRFGHVADSCVCYSVQVWIYTVFSGRVAMLEKRCRHCQLVLVLSTLSVRASVIVYGFKIYLHCLQCPSM